MAYELYYAFVMTSNTFEFTGFIVWFLMDIVPLCNLCNSIAGSSLLRQCPSQTRTHYRTNVSSHTNGSFFDLKCGS